MHELVISSSRRVHHGDIVCIDDVDGSLRSSDTRDQPAARLYCALIVHYQRYSREGGYVHHASRKLRHTHLTQSITAAALDSTAGGQRTTRPKTGYIDLSHAVSLSLAVRAPGYARGFARVITLVVTVAPMGCLCGGTAHLQPLHRPYPSYEQAHAAAINRYSSVRQEAWKTPRTTRSRAVQSRRRCHPATSISHAYPMRLHARVAPSGAHDSPTLADRAQTTNSPGCL